MKPKIWLRYARYYCAVLLNPLTVCGSGDTPAEAYASWVERTAKQKTQA